MDNFVGHYVKLNKLVCMPLHHTKILHDSTYMKSLEGSNSWRQRTKLSLSGAGERGLWGVSVFRILVLQNEKVLDTLYTTSELYTEKMVNKVNCMLCIFCHNLK